MSDDPTYNLLIVIMFILERARALNTFPKLYSHSVENRVQGKHEEGTLKIILF